MASKAKPNRGPGSGLSRWGGTEAPSRPNLEVTSSPPFGAGDPSLSDAHTGGSTPAPIKEKLALGRSGADIVTGGDGLGDRGERGTGKGAQKSGGSLPTSLLIHILSEHRDACREAKAAIEAIILKLHIEDRVDLAIALCKINQVLRGGAL